MSTTILPSLTRDQGGPGWPKLCLPGADTSVVEWQLGPSTPHMHLDGLTEQDQRDLSVAVREAGDLWRVEGAAEHVDTVVRRIAGHSVAKS